ncbi:30S ribosomal protein S20 [Thermodesulfobacteriota bacterium]
MANHKSALKRHRQSLKKHARNTAIRTNLKSSVKKLRAGIASKDKDISTTELQNVIIKLDRAVTKGVLHKNNASRRTSRLTKQVNSL